MPPTYFPRYSWLDLLKVIMVFFVARFVLGAAIGLLVDTTYGAITRVGACKYLDMTLPARCRI